MLENSIIQTLQQLFPPETHHRLFLVGGTVRDTLLAQQRKDIDLLVALPDEQLAACGFRYVTSKSTVPIWFRTHPRLGSIEATQLADPSEVDAELTRRDFTVNAMAFSLNGQLHDPLNGRSDLDKRQLAVCSDNCFNDDPLRIFRALRFEADGWRLSRHSESLITAQDWSVPLAGIPVERFSRELLKALTGEDPTRFFSRLLQLTIGCHWLTELFAMPQVPAGPTEHHPEGDLFSHSLHVLQRMTKLSPDPLARFCALFHDLGKLKTDPMAYPQHHGHDQAGVTPAKDLCNRLRLPARYRTALSAVNRLHTTMNRWDELREATRLRLAEQARKNRIEEILPLVSQADKPGCVAPATWELTLKASRLPIRDLGLHQETLDALPPEARSSLIFDRRIGVLRMAVR